MGFKVIDVFRGVAGAAGSLGGTIGAIGTIASGALGPVSRPSPSFVPMIPGIPEVADGGGVTPVGVPAAVGGMVLAGARQIGAILARIAVKIGRRVSLRSVADFIRRFGPSAVVGSVLGITAEEAITLLMADHTRRFKRHRRGISAADIRRTGSTLSKLGTLNRRVHGFIAHAGLRPRSARFGRHSHRVTSVPARKR